MIVDVSIAIDHIKEILGQNVGEISSETENVKMCTIKTCLGRILLAV